MKKSTKRGPVLVALLQARVHYTTDPVLWPLEAEKQRWQKEAAQTRCVTSIMFRRRARYLIELEGKQRERGSFFTFYPFLYHPSQVTRLRSREISLGTVSLRYRYRCNCCEHSERSRGKECTWFWMFLYWNLGHVSYIFLLLLTFKWQKTDYKTQVSHLLLSFETPVKLDCKTSWNIVLE